MSISEGWKSYRAVIVPPTAGEVQVSECRRAFYGGAAHLLGLMMADAKRPENVAVEHLTKWRDELARYAASEGKI